MEIKELAPAFQFASWRVPQSPETIEYPLEVMEEVRAFACDELLQLSHGGDEVGGVLFGTRRENLIRILTWRPIACEHSQGESLLLSSSDRMNLAVQLELARQNADLKDLRPVGCFLSHLRGGVSLSGSDSEIYNGFFPEAWQVALVICPKGNGRAQAGFFLREAGGKLQAEASYKCFDLQPFYPASSATTVSGPEPEARRVQPARTAAAVPTAAPMRPAAQQPPLRANTIAPVEPRRPSRPAPDIPLSIFESPSFQTEETIPTRERWLWAIPIVLALGVAAFMLLERRSPSPSTIALRAAYEAQTVELAWDANARAIRDAYRGEIQISDGGKNSQVSLSIDQLHAGKLSYLPQSGDIGFELTIYPTNGDPIHDSTRFIAPGFHAPTQPPQLLPVSPPPASPPPASPAPANSPPTSSSQAKPAAPQAGQSALEQQVQQLKQDLGKERARADELQNLVRILENRLGIQPTTPKPEQSH